MAPTPYGERGRRATCVTRTILEKERSIPLLPMEAGASTDAFRVLLLPLDPERDRPLTVPKTGPPISVRRTAARGRAGAR